MLASTELTRHTEKWSSFRLCAKINLRNMTVNDMFLPRLKNVCLVNVSEENICQQVWSDLRTPPCCLCHTAHVQFSLTTSGRNIRRGKARRFIRIKAPTVRRPGCRQVTSFVLHIIPEKYILKVTEYISTKYIHFEMCRRWWETQI